MHRLNGFRGRSLSRSALAAAFFVSALGANGVGCGGTADGREELNIGEPACGQWSREAVAQPDAESFQPSVAVDGDSSVHVTYHAGGGDMQLDVRGPDGTWNRSGLPTTGVDGASMVLDAQGGEHVTFLHIWSGFMKYAHRTPGGQWAWEWLPKSHAKDTSLAIDRVGNLHLLENGFGSDIYYLYRPHNGAAWSNPERIADGKHAQLVVDDEGGFHIAKEVVRNDASFVYYAYRSPAGVWSEEQVNTRGNEAPRIALDQAGGVHLVYKATGRDELVYAYRPKGEATWTFKDVGPASRGSRGLVVDATNTVHPLYQQGDSLLYATASIGGAFTSETLSQADKPVTAATLAADASGAPHVVYVERTNPEDNVHGRWSLLYGHRARCQE